MEARLIVRIERCRSYDCIVTVSGCVFCDSTRCVKRAAEAAVALTRRLDPEKIMPGEYGMLDERTIIVKTYDVEPFTRLECVENIRLEVPLPPDPALLALVALARRVRSLLV